MGGESVKKKGRECIYKNIQKHKPSYCESLTGNSFRQWHFYYRRLKFSTHRSACRKCVSVRNHPQNRQTPGNKYQPIVDTSTKTKSPKGNDFMRLAKKKCPVIFTGEALTSIPAVEHDWVVDRLFRTNRRRPSLIAGKPGSGKSTLAWQMAIAVTKGEPFLGRQTKPSEVLYWQSEETQEDCGAILREHGYDSSRDKRIHVAMGASWGDTLDEQLERSRNFSQHIQAYSL